MAAGVTGQVFPGGSACISFRDHSGSEELVAACAGTLAKGEARVEESTRYDLAAITQCFVAVSALRMAARGALDLDASAESVLSDVRGGVLGETTLRALLAHRAGLAPWGGLYLDVPHEPGSSASRRWIVSEAARRSGDPRDETRVPGDLGYIVAGEAIARVAGIGLDEVVAREVLEPLGLAEHIGYPGALPSEKRAALARQTAPTERCEWRGRIVRGEVHDENAAALGGVAGHAGLFGTAQAVALFGRAILDSLSSRSDFLRAEVLESALRELPDKSPLRVGFYVKQGVPAACGRRMSARSFGMLGLTGTSMFCDPDKDVVIVLLTNRICPSRANEKIDGFRPAFHDGVLAALSG
jgi:CubicO group peptidase (beta-lactamase class C family)